MTRSSPAISADTLRSALRLRPFDGRAAQRIMEPAGRGTPPPAGQREMPREAAALAYLFEQDGDLRLPLTLRRADLREHSGQVSLPGGRPEAREDLWQTALRESEEEIGLRVPALERVGVLTPVYIPVTHTRLHVHVGVGPAPAALRANPAEVVRVQLVSLADLLTPDRRRCETRTLLGRVREVPCFDFDGLEVWGATAMALSELAERVRAVLAS
jgi:8-oxo-dGTP pyrophosphatase MutT (NUDIX family)